MAATLFAFKLCATPLLILGASLAGRRWGGTVGGWFVGLPLTSGPVILFVALGQGIPFAAAAIYGSLDGAAAEAWFCLAYALAAEYRGWSAALAAGSLAYAAAGLALGLADLTLWPLVACVAVTLAAALALLPRDDGTPARRSAVPRWDIPWRMATATAIVVGLTEAAPYLGPRLSGICATYPAFAATLAAFAHHAEGKEAAVRVLRGLLAGLFAFVGFFAVLELTLEAAGIALGFAAASAAALAIQAGSLALLRR
jgi:hypothetical protein